MMRRLLFANSTVSWTLSFALHAAAVAAAWPWWGRSNVDSAVALLGKSGANTITVEMALVEQAISEAPITVEFAVSHAHKWVSPSARPLKSDSVNPSQHDLQRPVAPESQSSEVAQVLARADYSTDHPPTPDGEPKFERVPTRQAQSPSPHLPSMRAEAGVTTTTDPQFYRNLPPIYPPEAQANGWQGTVLLRLEISAAGAVSAVHIERGSGYTVLDRAAVEAVRLWRARPATRGGHPVATTEFQPVIFRLK